MTLQLHDAAHYPSHVELLPCGVYQAGPYRARFATSKDDLDKILRLRFEVFNLELAEGLERSFENGRDEDLFDQHCHHVLVETTDGPAAEVVGTYRMQTHRMALEGVGFYSQNEFQLDQLSMDIVARSVELGRACIAHPHRNRQVLFLLWRGLASYVEASGSRYLFGCSSITSQDPLDGLKMEMQLRQKGHLHPSLRVEPQPENVCRGDLEAACRLDEIAIPRLFRTYLRYSGKICSPPAIDAEFGTIDFLMLVDVEDLDHRSRKLFFSS